MSMTHRTPHEHFLSDETGALVRRNTTPRADLKAAMDDFLPGRLAGMPADRLAEAPMVASPGLLAELERMLQSIKDLWPGWIEAARPHQNAWGAVLPPDVLCLDIAVTQEGSHRLDWGLRIVELQAFTSLAATAILLQHAHASVWTALTNRPVGTAFGSDIAWRAQMKAWIVREEGGVVAENAPMVQGTWFDLEAMSVMWNMPVVDPASATLKGWGGHVVNRSIPHETPNLGAWQNWCAAHTARGGTWHSHPAWYDGFNKSQLLDIADMQGRPVAVSAAFWRELGEPPERLVLKHMSSCGGKDVIMHVTTNTLNALDNPHDWLVQPRFQAADWTIARDGAPVRGEIRLLVDVRGSDWAVMGRLVRLTRHNMVSSNLLTGAPGEGATLLYDPA